MFLQSNCLFFPNFFLTCTFSLQNQVTAPGKRGHGHVVLEEEKKSQFLKAMLSNYFVSLINQRTAFCMQSQREKRDNVKRIPLNPCSTYPFSHVLDNEVERKPCLESHDKTRRCNSIVSTSSLILSSRDSRRLVSWMHIEYHIECKSKQKANLMSNLQAIWVSCLSKHHIEIQETDSRDQVFFLSFFHLLDLTVIGT